MVSHEADPVGTVGHAAWVAATGGPPPVVAGSGRRPPVRLGPPRIGAPQLPAGWPAEIAADAAWALRQAEVRRWRPGATLVPGRGPQDGLYWLQRGAVRLAATDPAGDPRLVGVVVAPALVGDPGPLFGRPPLALTATCVTPCTAAFWPYARFLAMLRQRPSLGVLLAFQGMEAYQQAAQRVAGLLWPCSRLRVLHTLVVLARAFPVPGGRGSRLPVSLTQGTIGLAANASRVTVNRVLADLRRRGIVGRARPLYIREPHRLEALLAEEAAAVAAERTTRR